MLYRTAMKLVIFDCDGTIVDSQHAIVAAMAAAFASHGLPEPAREAVIAVVGLSLTDAVARLVPGHDARSVGRLAESYKSAFADLRAREGHREPLFPGAREVIAALAERGDVVLGVATGKSRRGVDVLFEREGLARYFHTIQTADDHPSKPHPSMIERAMCEVGAERAGTVMVGDTVFDVEMARHAAVGAVGVTWGYHPAEELSRAGAHALVAGYEELTPAIDRLLADGPGRR
jgi:phosphoglycolate phosphatase